MKPKERFAITGFVLAALVFAMTAKAAPAQDTKEIPWGKPVDGLVCRLVIEPSYFIGQPINAFIEVKNISAKKGGVL